MDFLKPPIVNNKPIHLNGLIFKEGETKNANK